MRVFIATLLNFFLLSATLAYAADNPCEKKYKACGAACQKITEETKDRTKLGCQTGCSMSYAACDVSSILPGGDGIVSWFTKKSPKKVVGTQCKANYESCGKKCDAILDETSDNNKLSCRSSCSATYAACDFTNLLPGKEVLTWVTTPSKPDLYSCEESYKLCGAECLKIRAESKIAGDTTRLGCQTACSTKYASCDFRGFFPGREVFSSFGDKVGAVGSFLQDIARSKKDKTQ